MKGFRDKSDFLREINDISVTAGPIDARIAPFERLLNSDRRSALLFAIGWQFRRYFNAKSSFRVRKVAENHDFRSTTAQTTADWNPTAI